MQTKITNNLIKLILSTLIVSSCNSSNNSTQNKSPTQVIPIGIVEKGDIFVNVNADGQLFSPTSIPIVVERVRWYWEYAVSWVAPEGSLVKAGDPVIKLDPSTIQKDLDEAQNSLKKAKLTLEEEQANAQDRLADVKSELIRSEFELKRAKLLAVDNDTVSSIEKKKFLLDISSAEANFKRNKEKIESTIQTNARSLELKKIDLKRAQEAATEMENGLEKLTLKAPQNGLVLYPLYTSNSGSRQKVSPGNTVSVNTLVSEIADPKNLLAKVYIPEIDANGIIEGTLANVYLDIYGNKEFKGKVTKVGKISSSAAERDGDKVSSPGKNIRQIEVWVAIEQLPENVVPGLSIKAVFQVTNKTNVLRIPIAYVNTAADNKNYVCASDKKNKWQKTEVMLGSNSYAYVEVLLGLSENTKIKSICN